MKYYFGCLAAILLAGVLTLAPMLYAQKNAVNSQLPCVGCSPDGKTTPRAADGHPDLSGIWDSQEFSEDGSGAGHLGTRSSDGSVLFDFGGPNSGGLARLDLAPNQPSYKPEYMAKVKAIGDGMYGGSTPTDPQMDCKPLGVPRSISGAPSGGVFQIIQTPQVVGILFESAPGPAYRVIYTDGRPHPKDLDTSYMGDSIGHWDGDTFVVDVVGLNDDTWLTDPRGGRQYTSIHSDQEHVIERYVRTGNVLDYQATVEDPVMFTKPWTVTKRIQHGGADDRIEEGICNGNDKSHFVTPTKEDSYICNYCSQATRTPGTGLATPKQ
jgi:hypothetical protein